MHFLTNTIYAVFALLLLPLNSIKAEIPNNSKSVAILGESYSSENNGSGINEEILTRLFTLIRKNPPSAVIFTGDMTLGLQKEANLQSPEGIKPTKPPLTDELTTDLLDTLDTTPWPQAGYAFNLVAFKKSMARFIEIKDDILGNNVPFYPIIGDHESFGSGAIEAVETAFKIQSQVPLLVSPLAYTFSIDKCLFLVFSTTHSTEKGDSNKPFPLSPPLLQWLNDTLQQQGKNFDFIFVVGNKPAFSTTEVIADFRGLDSQIPLRDAFWRILMKNKVTAYFCSKEHLYDRTNRYGIWQIISGGAGAPLYKREFDKAFYHYLRLILPNKDQKLPKVKVFDTQDNLIDDFDLAPTQYPVYQLRIS
jgi:hypothetical protein